MGGKWIHFLYQKIDLIRDLWEFAGKAFASGALRVIVHKVLFSSLLCSVNLFFSLLFSSLLPSFPSHFAK